MKAIGIITARGGSKGVPRKNIRLVAGYPLLAYTIWSAQASRRLDHFVTSTEDPEIASIARQWGSSVLPRPAELATDQTRTVPVVLHVLECLAGDYDTVVLLQPTAPQRTGADIDAALDLLEASGAAAVVSVYQVSDEHPSRMFRVVEGRLVPYEPELQETPRQALPPVYHRNGAIYACRRSLVVNEHTLLGQAPQPYVMPSEQSINIDTELDLTFAGFVLGQRLHPDMPPISKEK